MKLRMLCVVAALFAIAGVAQAADTGKNGDASNGTKKLTIPSMEMGGGSVGVSTTQPNGPNVPGLNDPNKQDKPVDPFIGLKFTKPLDSK